MLVRKVSEKEACSIARAIWEEFLPHLEARAKPASTHFMETATRLSKTGHENRFADSFTRYGLAADIAVSSVDVGLKSEHPILKVDNTVCALDSAGKLNLLFMSNPPDAFERFWSKWKLVQPRHPVFDTHHDHLGSCIPVAMHCDEGLTLKKKSMMIIQWQPLMGQGTRKRKSTELDPGCNMAGHSLTTRFLWACMLSRVYGGKRANKPLLKLLAHLSSEFSKAFMEGIKLQSGQVVYLVPLGLKGDWPALTKCGQLTRHHGRMSLTQKPGHGICHFCKADMDGHREWHKCNFEAMSAMRTGGVELPWKRTPVIVKAVPIPESYQPDFFRPDIFHTLHKGVFADMAANAIVP